MLTGIAIFDVIIQIVAFPIQLINFAVNSVLALLLFDILMF